MGNIFVGVGFVGLLAIGPSPTCMLKLPKRVNITCFFFMTIIKTIIRWQLLGRAPMLSPSSKINTTFIMTTINTIIIRWRLLGWVPVRRCTRSWCLGFNGSPPAVGSSEFFSLWLGIYKLQQLTTCSGSKCFFPERLQISIIIWHLNELKMQTLELNTGSFMDLKLFPWLRLEHVKTSRLPLYIADQQTLYEKFADTFIFR